MVSVPEDLVNVSRALCHFLLTITSYEFLSGDYDRQHPLVHAQIILAALIYDGYSCIVVNLKMKLSDIWQA